MKTIPIERVRQMLNYDPDTGEIRWKEKPGRNIAVGSIAGGGGARDGYRYISLDGTRIGAHRIAYAHFYGLWPASLIDHRDGNRGNNAISNLREAGRSLNALNLHGRARAASGHRGVYRIKGRQNFFASFAGRHLGTFPTAEQASAAYTAAKTTQLSSGGI